MSTQLLAIAPLLLLTASMDRVQIQMPSNPGSPILPRATHEYGARGPMVICVSNFAISVDRGESIYVLDEVVRLLNDDHVIAIMEAGPDHQSAGMAIVGEGGAEFRRFTGQVSEAVFVPEFSDNRVRYTVRDQSTGRTVIVGSSTFDGSAGDLSLLERLHAPPADPTGCTQPLSFATGELEPSRAVFEVASGAKAVGLYPLAPDPGPAYHCQGGIGFRIEAGETILRPWRPLGEGVSWLMTGGTRIKISANNEPLRKGDDQDAAEHPLGLLHQSRIIYYPSRGIGPPYAPPGVREDGSWSVELGTEQNSRLEISFPASDKTPQGFRFLERLEYVGEGDPRCRKLRG